MKLPLLVLLIVAVSCSAADYVTITLKDGRVLTGYYDNNQLSMEDGKIVLPIKRDDVVTVREAEIPTSAPQKPEAKTRPFNPMAKEIEDFRAAHAKRAALYDQQQIAEAELQAARTAAIARFLKIADLTPVTVTVSQAPSRGDVERVAEISRFNRDLEQLRSAGGRPQSSDFYTLYARLKNAPWLLDFSR